MDRTRPNPATFSSMLNGISSIETRTEASRALTLTFGQPGHLHMAKGLPSPQRIPASNCLMLNYRVAWPVHRILILLRKVPVPVQSAMAALQRMEQRWQDWQSRNAATREW